MVEVFKNWFVQLHEDDLVRDAIGESLLLGLGPSLDHKQRFALDGALSWGLDGELHVLAADRVDEQEVRTTLEVAERTPTHETVRFKF